MRFMCCLIMGLNLTILKIHGKALRPGLIITSTFLFAKKLHGLWHSDDVQRFNPDAILFPENPV